jgi:hypothetical protein
MAGVWYLLMAVCSGFSLMGVDKQIIVPGNADATARNILASEGLYRLGFVSNIAGQIVFLFLALALYRLLKSVDGNQARLMVALVVASVPVACLSMLFQFTPLLLLGGAPYLGVFEPAQLHALAMLSLEVYGQGIILVGFFWGLWLLPFGILVYRSGFLPKILGVCLVIGCCGYVIDSLSVFLFPAYAGMLDPVVMVTGLIGEIPILLWLLIVGVKDPNSAEVAIG